MLQTKKIYKSLSMILAALAVLVFCGSCTQIKEKESLRMIQKLKDDAYIFTLEIEGKKFSSESFSKELETLAIKGKSHICFIIGGSLGLHKSIIDLSNQSISFSNMTFPHQLMRVILCEQVYRAFRIKNGEPYHK